VIADCYRRVIERVAAAAERSGRRAQDVTVVVATKKFPATVVRELLDAGATDIGENYVQEAREKRLSLGNCQPRWHLIGHLQRNKARAAAALFDVVHSVDSLAIAEALDRELDHRIPCLVQVNLGRESTKDGVIPEAVEETCAAVSSFPNLSLEGLMAIPPPAADPASARRAFAMLRELRERLRIPGVHLKDLSMGMSADFEEAIAEGATIVRVGSAILGPRGS
jgi:pyridoxal phosphate enzyme (YggS family)